VDRPQSVSHGLRRAGVNNAGAAVVELRDASKSYGAVQALRDGNLALRSGEVRALMGENGAGKSTLVKVLGGVVRRDAGDMLVDGEPVDFHSPHGARDAGIAVILISHRMPDVFSVCQRVVVMRRGTKVADKSIDRSSPEEVTALITGAREAA